MSSSEEFSDTSSEEYLSDDSECLDFEEIKTPGSSVCASHLRTLSIVVFFGGLQASDIRRNLMHADSFLFISRVAASKNHTFFNHFLSLTIKHYRESSHIFCTMSFSYATLHIWTHLAEWGTNANDKWKYRQDCLHSSFSARKKKGFNISESHFRKWVLERYGNLPQENKLKR